MSFDVSPSDSEQSTNANLLFPPKPRLVFNLCHAVSDNITVSTGLGMLKESENGYIMLHSNPAITDKLTVTSLSSLLARGMKDNRQTRLTIALELVSGLLQVHNTRWLDSSWTSQDVFVLEEDSGRSRSGSIYISCSESLKASDTTHTPATPDFDIPEWSLVRNRSIFSLGIILIELWFGKSLKEHHLVTSGAMNDPDSIAEKSKIARVVLDEVYQEAGLWYGDAVRRCLFCEFDQRDTSLKVLSMVEAVHQGVYMPLLRYLNAFCGLDVPL